MTWDEGSSIYDNSYRKVWCSMYKYIASRRMPKLTSKLCWADHTGHNNNAPINVCHSTREIWFDVISILYRGVNKCWEMVSYTKSNVVCFWSCRFIVGSTYHAAARASIHPKSVCSGIQSEYPDRRDLAPYAESSDRGESCRSRHVHVGFIASGRPRDATLPGPQFPSTMHGTRKVATSHCTLLVICKLLG